MPHRTRTPCLLLLFLWRLVAAGQVVAQNSSSSVVTNGFSDAPFQIEIWAGNVPGARGLVIDDAGDVLVVAPGAGGIFALWEEADGQVNRTLIVNSSSLNHGITLNGNYLYASSSNTAWRWNYQAGQRSLADGNETVVQNIDRDETGQLNYQDHVTRSLAIDKNGILYVSVGATSNVDSDAFRARIRSFNLSNPIPSGGHDFVSDGIPFANGLRNEVGLGFDGQGRLWGVENGADNLDRTDLGGDIHANNPAEELNLFNETIGTFYGYPFCWSEFNLPTFGTGPGSQWAWPSLENATITDAWCKNRTNVRPPELAMQAHSAPLGITFYDGTNCGTQIRNSTATDGTAYSIPCEYSGHAFVSFHGSWDRDVPVGYKVSRIAFDNSTGLPTSKNASESMFDIFGALNSQTQCAGNARTSCLRPVDVKFDKTGALLVTSDATGVIYRVTSTSAVGPPPTPVSSPAPALAPAPSSAQTPAPVPTPSSAPRDTLGPRMESRVMFLLLRAFVPALLYLLWQM